MKSAFIFGGKIFLSAFVATIISFIACDTFAGYFVCSLFLGVLFSFILKAYE